MWLRHIRAPALASASSAESFPGGWLAAEVRGGRPPASMTAAASPALYSQMVERQRMMQWESSFGEVGERRRATRVERRVASTTAAAVASPDLTAAVMLRTAAMRTSTLVLSRRAFMWSIAPVAEATRLRCCCWDVYVLGCLLLHRRPLEAGHPKYLIFLIFLCSRSCISGLQSCRKVHCRKVHLCSCWSTVQQQLA
jgi:hypothetical protein